MGRYGNQRIFPLELRKVPAYAQERMDSQRRIPRIRLRRPRNDLLSAVSGRGSARALGVQRAFAQEKHRGFTDSPRRRVSRPSHANIGSHCTLEDVGRNLRATYAPRVALGHS